MVRKYLHQVESRITGFSDAPLRIDGVRYQPKWAWSKDYRKCFRQTYGRCRMLRRRVNEINRRGF